jgi:hypothetical protein
MQVYVLVSVPRVPPPGADRMSPDFREENRGMMCELRHTSLVVQKMQGRDTSACACGHHRSRLPSLNTGWSPRDGTETLGNHLPRSGFALVRKKRDLPQHDETKASLRRGFFCTEKGALNSSVAEVLKRQTPQPIIALCQMRRCRTGSWFEHGGERGNGKGMFTKR